MFSSKVNGPLRTMNEELEFYCIGPLGGMCRIKEHGIQGGLHQDFGTVIFIRGSWHFFLPDQVSNIRLGPLIVCPANLEPLHTHFSKTTHRGREGDRIRIVIKHPNLGSLRIGIKFYPKLSLCTKPWSTAIHFLGWVCITTPISSRIKTETVINNILQYVSNPKDF